MYVNCFALCIQLVRIVKIPITYMQRPASTGDPITSRYIASGLNREAVPFAVSAYGDDPTKVNLPLLTFWNHAVVGHPIWHAELHNGKHYVWAFNLFYFYYTDSVWLLSNNCPAVQLFWPPRFWGDPALLLMHRSGCLTFQQFHGRVI